MCALGATNVPHFAQPCKRRSSRALQLPARRAERFIERGNRNVRRESPNVHRPSLLASLLPAPCATPSVTASPMPTATRAEEPQPTPVVNVIKGPAWHPRGVDTPIVIFTRAYEYAPSGRSPGMDNPALGCTPIDESRPSSR